MVRRFATKRQRRFSLLAGVLGNVVPVVVLGSYHRVGETHGSLVVGLGTTLAILSPLATNLLPGRHQWLLRLFGSVGIVGLTMMQAGTGGVGSSYAILFVMPMIWFGLTASGSELKAAAVLVLACCLLPMLIWPSQYPRQVRPAVALAIVSLSVLFSLAVASREVRRLTHQLRHEATHDRLTGLLNRRGWDESTERALTSSATRDSVCVVLVDLDGLKQVNDTMGHDEGDRLLQDTARRFGDAFAGEAAVSRLGGDEFAVLILGSRPEDVHDRLTRLGAVTPERGAFSAGLAQLAPGEQLGDAMRRADLALYEVKSTGRGRAALAGPPVS